PDTRRPITRLRGEQMNLLTRLIALLRSGTSTAEASIPGPSSTDPSGDLASHRTHGGRYEDLH
ncbi:MAG: hypothetical protein KDK91_12650, partial [Gammaproteobacteria bacterium]|nr:hypothetical protein [Gammaproteobacteria bacterium]